MCGAHHWRDDDGGDDADDLSSAYVAVSCWVPYSTLMFHLRDAEVRLLTDRESVSNGWVRRRCARCSDDERAYA